MRSSGLGRRRHFGQELRFWAPAGLKVLGRSQQGEKSSVLNLVEEVARRAPSSWWSAKCCLSLCLGRGVLKDLFVTPAQPDQQVHLGQRAV